MRIFQNKIPNSWKSSGVILKNNQIEMSNFSFAEDCFFSKENKFIINIIGKNIIGNGLFSVSILKNNLLVWREDFSFLNISFSKKTLEIEEESKKEYKIIISRGKGCKGKILIDSVSIINEESKKIKDYIVVQSQQPLEDEPIFTSSDEYQENIVKKETKALNVKKETKKIEKVPRKKRIKKELIINQEYTQDQQEELNKNIEIKKIRNNVAVSILDFSLIKDEKDSFKYINQISFRRGKQIFLIKNNENLNFDFSKYDYVKVFTENIEIINELEKINPNNIIFDLNNLNQELLEIVKKIKDEL